MLMLNTYVHETIWGGKRLAEIAGIESEKVGHLYSLCCEPELETLIANGPYKGQNFQAYFQTIKKDVGLEKYEEFPLIIALVEARDDLSIQVHPNDEFAILNEKAEYGKNESWFFLETPQMGGIYNGCLEKDIEKVKSKVDNNDLMSIVDILPVEKGDYVYVEAGTIHALTCGSYLYEIEENSPWTYRLYDYDRVDAQNNKRELHIGKALQVIDPELKSVAKKMESEAFEERRYSIQKYENLTQYTNNSTTLECITFIEGECLIEDGVIARTGNTVVLEPGETLSGEMMMIIVARPK